MSISKNIKTVRKKWRDNQAGFGARFGVGKSAVSKWEQGENEPSPGVLIALEEMTGIPAKRLYRDEIGSGEVGIAPGEFSALGTNPYREREEELMKKIGSLVVQLDETEREKLKVFEALQVVIKFLEGNLDESQYKERKKEHLDRLAAILSGG